MEKFDFFELLVDFVEWAWSLVVMLLLEDDEEEDRFSNLFLIN